MTRVLGKWRVGAGIGMVERELSKGRGAGGPSRLVVVSAYASHNYMDTSECVSLPFPQIDIIGAMVIVWRVREKIIRSVLCNIVCNSCAQCNAHIYEQTLTVLWIGFCLTGPILLCIDSFLCMYYYGHLME